MHSGEWRAWAGGAPTSPPSGEEKHCIAARNA
jgi:hypothetical protein